MVLVDTSVWVDHLRTEDPTLVDLLERSLVCMHPMVVGELACGNLQNRKTLLSLWNELPQSVKASHDEVLLLIEQKQLMGKGVGYVDLHLLAATLLSSDTHLWTRDKRLMGLAESMLVDF